jgi:hypothetical protein
MPLSQAGGKEKGTDMSRIGKIARLPHDIREQLNRRLQDGQSGPEILHWVNELPPCRQMLAQKFGSRPIDENNLYEWRHGGYEEWLYHEDRRDLLQSRFEHIAKLDAVGDGNQVAERLGVIVASELALALNYLEGINDMNDRWSRLREICKELSRFRRENCNHQRLRLAEQRLENQSERQRNRLQPEQVGRVAPCAPPQLQPKSRARTDAPTPARNLWATDH